MVWTTDFYFLTFLEFKTSKVKAPADWVLSEEFLPGLQMATFLPCPHMTIPWLALGERELMCLLLSVYCLVAQLSSVFCDPMDVHQGALSMGFSRQEHWSGLPFPSPGDLPNPGIKPTSPESPALAGRFFTCCATREALLPVLTRALIPWRECHTHDLISPNYQKGVLPRWSSGWEFIPGWGIKIPRTANPAHLNYWALVPKKPCSATWQSQRITKRVHAPQWRPNTAKINKPSYLLKVPPPNTITLRVRVPTYEFEGTYLVRKPTICQIIFIPVC